MKRSLLVILAFLLPGVLKSQSLSFSTGIATDANNPKKSFYFIPIELKWHPMENSAFSVVLNYDIGLNSDNHADAYTLNPSMEPHKIVNETIKTNLFTIGISFDINLYRMSNANNFNLSLMPVGFCFQRLKASYNNFDHENYSILNQETDKSNSGIVSSFGLQYQFNTNKIIGLNVQTPLYLRREKSMTYKYVAPARLMFGYRFNYKKQK